MARPAAIFADPRVVTTLLSNILVVVVVVVFFVAVVVVAEVASLADVSDRKVILTPRLGFRSPLASLQQGYEGNVFSTHHIRQAERRSTSGRLRDVAHQARYFSLWQEEAEAEEGEERTKSEGGDRFPIDGKDSYALILYYKNLAKNHQVSMERDNHSPQSTLLLILLKKTKTMHPRGSPRS